MVYSYFSNAVPTTSNLAYGVVSHVQQQTSGKNPVYEIVGPPSVRPRGPNQKQHSSADEETVYDVIA